MAAVCRALSQARVHVLIRPRPGDFLYSPEELQVMRQDVLHAASLGAHGVVLGMLTPGGGIDTRQLQPFVELCSALGLDLTFHRAFDLVKDQRVALNDLVACRVRRVLSSGGQQTVMEGLSALAQLVAEGGSRISVMPGGGLTEENVATVARVSGCSEVHGTFKRQVPSAMEYRHTAVSFGVDDWSRGVTDTAAVQRVKAQLAQVDGTME
ncbi:copper homeostasis [Chlorella sorokiniana]|uniref:Copper homeostasis protein cutC homolog n=1 Tax=Chlorella sorokiniana TaxID=3076 RepID=A0A2P6TJL9_CHLSO|nr:copper homeostasis [Chlorella sorokiniana]|eukprot:PRW44263.1 copper homeostasis [Chlorella sorokiniana]